MHFEISTTVNLVTTCHHKDIALLLTICPTQYILYWWFIYFATGSLNLLTSRLISSFPLLSPSDSPGDRVCGNQPGWGAGGLWSLQPPALLQPRGCRAELGERCWCTWWRLWEPGIHGCAAWFCSLVLLMLGAHPHLLTYCYRALRFELQIHVNLAATSGLNVNPALNGQFWKHSHLVSHDQAFHL